MQGIKQSERTMEKTIQFKQEVIDAEHDIDVYGEKSVSPLINLRSFDIIQSFVPDYMHMWRCCKTDNYVFPK